MTPPRLVFSQHDIKEGCSTPWSTAEGYVGVLGGGSQSSGTVLKDGVLQQRWPNLAWAAPLLPFGNMSGGRPEPTLPGCCFREDWFPGSELGS